MHVNTKPLVLIIDGEPAQMALMNRVLQADCELMLAANGRSALRLLKERRPELVLLDVATPALEGAALAGRLRAASAAPDLPLIFLCDRAEAGHEQRAFEAGAADVLARPLSAAAVAARVALHLQLGRARAALADQAGHLAALVAARTAELEGLQDATVLTMASLAETRDSLTVNHLRRTQHYVAALARALRRHPRFAGQLDEPAVALLFKAAPLHDVGKVGVPDAILLKPDRLSAAEYAVMQRHTEYGRDALLAVEQHLGGGNAFLRVARDIAYSHQEKFDGSGYPQGLAGDAIPLSARLMAVADVYDALISRRVYKPAFTHETAIELVRQGRGSHFDPDVVDAMLAIEADIMAIAARYPDAAG